MIFKKAKQNRIFQDIVDQVQQAVVAGELSPGEKLPPEREMCSIFNTSRGTLREALRILEQKKLISIKLGAGGGAIVREPNSELITENLSLLTQALQGSPSQLANLTADVFGLLASLAAAKADAADVGSLKQLVAEVTDAMGEQPAAESVLMNMERLLLIELARIGGNPFYFFFLEAALETIKTLIPPSVSIDETVQKQHYKDIRMIVYAVAKNDRKSATQLAGKHIHQLASLTVEKRE